MNLMESEVAEIKNERQALTNLRQKVHWAADAQSKHDVDIEETA